MILSFFRSQCGGSDIGEFPLDVLDGLPHLLTGGSLQGLDIGVSLLAALHDEGHGALTHHVQAGIQPVGCRLQSGGLLLSAGLLAGIHHGAGISLSPFADSSGLSLSGQHLRNGFL